MNQAKVYEELVTIPTYRTGNMEKDPLFIEKRAYQGSTGKVYPVPICEKISETREDVEYKAVILENDYLYVMILPELGGRIQRALDKTNGYDFVYYNRVIKPALVGLAGPWISGGIEFNWPQHHRPSTFMPVDYTFAENPDGSATVTIGETDRIYGTKGNDSITLYPDKAYIEIRGRLFNPTDYPQTFMWWANPAVHVNDDTFSVFPPDVNAVMDHGKRAVSTFPIATGEYYKADYSAGVDISRYKNIKVPTSYMAAHSQSLFRGSVLQPGPCAGNAGETAGNRRIKKAGISKSPGHCPGETWLSLFQQIAVELQGCLNRIRTVAACGEGAGHLFEEHPGLARPAGFRAAGEVIVVDLFQEPELLLAGGFPGHEGLAGRLRHMTGFILAALVRDVLHR
jgi:hypothetical protein